MSFWMYMHVCAAELVEDGRCISKAHNHKFMSPDEFYCLETQFTCVYLITKSYFDDNKNITI